MIPLGGDLFRYAYQVEYVAGGELALAQISTYGALAEDLHVSAGWEVVAATSPAMLSVCLAPTDDLQAYLDADNRLLEFDFISDVAPGRTLGWAGEFTFSVTGPASLPVPEPGSIAFLGVGL